MDVSLNQLAGPPKRIGQIRGMPVMSMLTKGGLSIITFNGKAIGAAPHRALARIIAQNAHPDLVIDELSKSEEVDPSLFAHLLPTWTEITNRINEE